MRNGGRGHTCFGMLSLMPGPLGRRTPDAKPSWRQATLASWSSKLDVQTAPQAPSQKTCSVPVAKPLTSTLLTSLTAPSSPEPATRRSAFNGKLQSSMFLSQKYKYYYSRLGLRIVPALHWNEFGDLPPMWSTSRIHGACTDNLLQLCEHVDR